MPKNWNKGGGIHRNFFNPRQKILSSKSHQESWKNSKILGFVVWKLASFPFRFRQKSHSSQTFSHSAKNVSRNQIGGNEALSQKHESRHSNWYGIPPRSHQWLSHKNLGEVEGKILPTVHERPSQKQKMDIWENLSSSVLMFIYKTKPTYFVP